MQSDDNDKLNNAKETGGNCSKETAGKTVDEIMADRELVAKILAEKGIADGGINPEGKNGGTSDGSGRNDRVSGAVAVAKKSGINTKAIGILSVVLVFFVLGIFVVSPFLQLIYRMLDEAFNENHVFGVNPSSDTQVYVYLYQRMILHIHILVQMTAAFLYIYWLYRIISERKQLKGHMKQNMLKLLPLLIFVFFDIGIALVTIIRGPNEYDLTGHPYMYESIFSYMLYPITYFFCGMMVYKKTFKDIILYALIITAAPLNILALVWKWGGSFKYYSGSGMTAVFHNSNHYGYYLMLVILASALLFVFECRVWLKVLELMSFILASMVLMINNTLGAFLAVSLSLFFLLIYRIVCENKAEKEAKSVAELTNHMMREKGTVGGGIEGYKENEGNTITGESSVTGDGTAIEGNIVIRDGDVATGEKTATGERTAIGIESGNTESKKGNTESKKGNAESKKENAESKKGNPESNRRIAVAEYFKKAFAPGSWRSVLFIMLLFVLITLIMNIFYKTIIDSLWRMFFDMGDIVRDPMEADYAGSKRWKLWKGTVTHLKEQPLVGFGVEGLLNTYGVGTPHNEFLQYAEFFGIPVAICYIAACATVLVRVMKNHKVMSTTTMICFFMTIGYLISSFFGVAIYYTTPFLYIFLGLTYAEYVHGNPNVVAVDSNLGIVNKTE